MGNMCCEEWTNPRPIVPAEKVPRLQSPPSVSLVQRSNILKPDDFQPRRYLGKGSFGSVVQVKRKHSKSDRVYAMKIIDKSQLKEQNLLETDMIEKTLSCTNNPYLVKVWCTFQNKQKIYIVMDYIERGDLYYYLAKQTFDEDTIRKLVPQIVQGLDELHHNDIIYRDLKPENVLVTSEGHTKLTDYGMACRSSHIDGSQLVTYIGVMEYMAPEILQKKGYDKMIDMWSLGVLIYELKHGKTPFRGETSEDTKKNIMNKVCEVDPSCSADLTSLIHQLLVKDPAKRLNIHDLRQHPFFKDHVDWQKVRLMQQPPPMKHLLSKVNILFKSANETAERTVVYISQSQKKKTHEPNLYEFSSEAVEHP